MALSRTAGVARTALFSRAFDAHRRERRWRLCICPLGHRHFPDRRQQIIHKRRREVLAVFVVNMFLRERSVLHLAPRRPGSCLRPPLDQSDAAVVGDDVFEHLYLAGVAVHLHHDNMRIVGGCQIEAAAPLGIRQFAIGRVVGVARFRVAVDAWGQEIRARQHDGDDPLQRQSFFRRAFHS